MVCVFNWFKVGYWEARLRWNGMCSKDGMAGRYVKWVFPMLRSKCFFWEWLSRIYFLMMMCELSVLNGKVFFSEWVVESVSSDVVISFCYYFLKFTKITFRGGLQPAVDINWLNKKKKFDEWVYSLDSPMFFWILFGIKFVFLGIKT